MQFGFEVVAEQHFYLNNLWSDRVHIEQAVAWH